MSEDQADRAVELSLDSFVARRLTDKGWQVTPPTEMPERDRMALESPTVQALFERIAATDRARELVNAAKAEQGTLDPGVADLLVDGYKFLTDEPDGIESVWGAGDNVLWPAGETLIIAGPQGVGKTTTAGNLVERLIGDEVRELLGLPVRCGQRVLYLAMDRPRQAARSLRRQLADVDPTILAERLVVWKGPPPHDLAQRPTVLAELAELARADVVVVDSLKDAAIGLSNDEVGAGWNRARQQLLVTGRNLLELHHTKKATKDKNGRPQTPDIDGLFGSTWITSGAGSVLLINGDPGDPVVSARHLKQPVAEVGPLLLDHNSDGSITVRQGADVVDLARTGVTAREAACAVFQTEKPSASQVEKMRRKLDAAEDRGVLTSDRTGRAVVWFTDPDAQPSSARDPDPILPLTSDDAGP